VDLPSHTCFEAFAQGLHSRRALLVNGNSWGHAHLNSDSLFIDSKSQAFLLE
jgi:hypothetical protein